jgi:chromosome segregation ATPase
LQELQAGNDALQVKLAEVEHAAQLLQERVEQSQGDFGSSSAECQRLQARLTKREDRVAELVAQVYYCAPFMTMFNTLYAFV